jgi:hypothetical protein
LNPKSVEELGRQVLYVFGISSAFCKVSQRSAGGTGRWSCFRQGLEAIPKNAGLKNFPRLAQDFPVSLNQPWTACCLRLLTEKLAIGAWSLIAAIA